MPVDLYIKFDEMILKCICKCHIHITEVFLKWMSKVEKKYSIKGQNMQK